MPAQRGHWLRSVWISLEGQQLRCRSSLPSPGWRHSGNVFFFFWSGKYRNHQVHTFPFLWLQVLNLQVENWLREAVCVTSIGSWEWETKKLRTFEMSTVWNMPRCLYKYWHTMQCTLMPRRNGWPPLLSKHWKEKNLHPGNRGGWLLENMSVSYHHHRDCEAFLWLGSILSVSETGSSNVGQG